MRLNPIYFRDTPSCNLSLPKRSVTRSMVSSSFSSMGSAGLANRSACAMYAVSAHGTDIVLV